MFKKGKSLNEWLGGALKGDFSTQKTDWGKVFLGAVGGAAGIAKGVETYNKTRTEKAHRHVLDGLDELDSIGKGPFRKR